MVDLILCGAVNAGLVTLANSLRPARPTGSQELADTIAESSNHGNCINGRHTVSSSRRTMDGRLGREGRRPKDPRSCSSSRR